MYRGLKPTHNEFYFPINTLLKEFYNNNGTLFYSNNPLSKTPSITQDLACIDISGSYKETCNVNTIAFAV